jgi:hypothetical protein
LGNQPLESDSGGVWVPAASVCDMIEEDFFGLGPPKFKHLRQLVPQNIAVAALPLFDLLQSGLFLSRMRHRHFLPMSRKKFKKSRDSSFVKSSITIR